MLSHDIPIRTGTQDNWRFCNKCNSLYFNGYSGGKCPAGGPHARQPDIDYNFVLPFASYGAGIDQSVANMPWGKYVDQFTSCIYDVNYKVNNYFSTILQLKYYDGVSLELDIESDFSNFTYTSDAVRDALAKTKGAHFMAHFCRPPGVPNRAGLGYDVDGKLAPDSIWRMQIPVGDSRDVALWGGRDLWVRSNNPIVVPTNSIRTRMVGDLKILTLEGRTAGTSMLQAGLGSALWVFLQVQVTLSDGTTPGTNKEPAKIDIDGALLLLAPSTVVDKFCSALVAGAQSQIPSNYLLDLESKLAADPQGFQTGYARGCLRGLFAALRNLWKTVVSIFDLAINWSPPAVASRLAREAVMLLASRELRARQFDEAKAIASLVSDTVADIAVRPSDYVVLSTSVGEALGKEAGLWFAEDFLQRSAPEIGEAVGNVVGQVMFEIIVQLLLVAFSEGVGNAARGGMAVGEATANGGRISHGSGASSSRLWNARPN